MNETVPGHRNWHLPSTGQLAQVCPAHPHGSQTGYELVPIQLWEPKKEDNQLHVLTQTQASPSREQEHASEVTAIGSHVHGYS